MSLSSSPKSESNWPLFVACAPGLEPMLLAEVEALGLPETVPTSVPGGVELTASFETLYRLGVELGLGLKLLLRVGAFDAKRFDQLVRKVSQLPWELFCGPTTQVEVKATCKSSRLYHSSAVEERIVNGVSQRLKRTVSAVEDSDAPGLKILVRIVDDHCVISVDCAGDLLSRRGYRLETAKAPLREDLARALILSAGWDPTTPLIDPFAGAGTIAMEADWLARNVPPGSLRSFAFMDMPFFDGEQFSAVRARALSRVRSVSPSIFASDRDPGAVAAARANAERAQSRAIVFEEASLSQAPWFRKFMGTRGAVVTNPPYGRRIGRDATLERLYRAFGDAVRTLPEGFQVGMAVAVAEHAHATRLNLRSALMTDHGGSKIYFSVRR